MYSNVPTRDPSDMKLRFKLRQNEFVQDDSTPLPHRYLLVPDGNMAFAQLCRKASHVMNMPVYHCYSGKYFIGFRCPHYIIEDVSWRREMKEKDMMNTVAASPVKSSSSSTAGTDDTIDSLFNVSELQSEISILSDESYENDWVDDADNEMDSEEEDEDYAPSEQCGFTAKRKRDQYPLRSSKRIKSKRDGTPSGEAA
ncbi:hypothetical protein NPX13_g8895 [Xylaria arbuscula]|uniref:Uncharacterized protein n=1 Tax=Xylaria arbuscula TaxID=114810 RepID=A0A9W8TJQ3_9PEZI|nr:hypothetical protein NPX13_g8895 [Xylaria arbuscula]